MHHVCSMWCVCRMLGNQMETDWTALFKAVFGCAYLTAGSSNDASDVSISGCRQRRNLCRHRPSIGPVATDFCSALAVPAVEEAWPRDVTVTSFPVPASTCCWNAAADRCSEKTVHSKGLHSSESFPVSFRLSLNKITEIAELN